MTTEKPQKPRIQLRGHHLGTFALDFWRNMQKDKNDTGVYDGINSAKRDKYKNIEYRLFGDNNRKSFEEELKDKHPFRTSNESQDLISSLYGPRMKMVVDFIYALLTSQPDTEVEIVEGLDSICLADCPMRTLNCARVIPKDEDELTLGFYDLEVGKVYTAREIVARVRDFTRRTGLNSPRDILWGTNQAQAQSV